MPSSSGFSCSIDGHAGVLPVDAGWGLGSGWSSGQQAGGRWSVRDVRRAHAVTVGDGREPLDVASEQAGEHLGLGLAQLRELGRDVGDRAVVLAQLVADGRAAHRGSVAVLAQRLASASARSAGSAASTAAR